MPKSKALAESRESPAPATVVQRRSEQPDKQAAPRRAMERRSRSPLPPLNGGPPADLAADILTFPGRGPGETRRAQMSRSMQGTVGNARLSRMTGGNLQAKLKVGAPDDIYEQEADRVADAVMRMPAEKRSLVNLASSPTVLPSIQHQCRECEEEQHGQIGEIGTRCIQAKNTSSKSAEASPQLETYLLSSRGAGQPLPNSVRTSMEGHFEQDFSGVRVHTDEGAARAAESVSARAFTVGRDIVFGAGQYRPKTSEGKQLLAHELTHVVQQNSTSNRMANSSQIVQRDDITRMSITPQYASGLSDEDLREHIQIFTEQTLEFEFIDTSTFEGEEEVAHSNLSILQAEQRRRQRRHETERRRRNRAVTEMCITPQHAEALSDENLGEQIQILSDQTFELEILRVPGTQGEEEVAHSNLSILQAEQRRRQRRHETERRRRNRAVTEMCITPQHAEALSDENLGEQIRILSDQTFELEILRAPGTQEEYRVAQSNLSILLSERRRRRVEQRRSRIHRTDWGRFRTHRDIDAAVSLEDRVLYVMETLRQRYNYPVDGAAAIVGNLMVESTGTMAPNILQGGRLARRGEPAPQRGGVGLVQWTAERREAVLETEQGLDILFDMDTQIAYMVRELRGRYARVNVVLNNPPNLNEATRIVYEVYEAPQPVVDAERARRGGDPAEIQRTRTEMNRAGLIRRHEASRARNLYLREHPE